MTYDSGILCSVISALLISYIVMELIVLHALVSVFLTGCINITFVSTINEEKQMHTLNASENVCTTNWDIFFHLLPYRVEQLK
jgi:hypothetical protein